MDTENKVYRELQIFLDTLPGGFSATESGSDIRLLKYMFTPEEAGIAMHLTMKPEPVKQIHDRVKKSGIPISIEELQLILDKMLYKGTLRPYYEGYDETYYRAPILPPEVCLVFSLMINLPRSLLVS